MRIFKARAFRVDLKMKKTGEEVKEVDIEAEKKRILEVHAHAIVDHTSDIDEMIKVWADDAWALGPNMPLVEDINTIRAVGEQLTNTKVIDMGELGKGLKRLEVSASGDLAYSVSRYRIVNEGPEGPVVEKGYEVSIFKKIGGEWKLSGYIWNKIE